MSNSVIGRLVVAMAASCALVTAAAAEPGIYVIDKDHTEVRFSWDHLGMSRQAGQFRDVIGRLAFDPEKPQEARLEVTIKAESLMTGVPALDQILKDTPDYLDIAQHPDITFKSSAVTMTSSKTGNVEGELTINGVTRPVVLAVVWNFHGEHPLSKINPIYQGVTAAGFSARTTILRSEYGITRAIPLVSDELRITIESELHRKY